MFVLAPSLLGGSVCRGTGMACLAPLGSRHGSAWMENALCYLWQARDRPQPFVSSCLACKHLDFCLLALV